MDYLSTREIAIVFWTVCFFIWQAKILGLKLLYKVYFYPLLDKRIKAVFLLVTFSALTTVFILARLELWDTEQLKTTIFWFLTIVFVDVIQAAREPKKLPNLWNTIKANLSVAAIIGFAASEYTFNIIPELIIVFVASTLALQQSSTRASRTHNNPTRNTLALIGMILTMNAAMHVYLDHTSLFSTKTLSSFYTPLLLSITFLPFLAALTIFFRVEFILRRLRWQIKKNHLRKLALKRALTKFKFNLSSIDRWLTSLGSLNIETEQDIDESIVNMKTIVELEDKNQYVPLREGWHISKAKDFLTSSGLTLEDYRSPDHANWFAHSNYLKASESEYMNSFNYRVMGNAKAVQSLELKMSIFHPEHDQQPAELHEKLLTLIRELMWSALTEPPSTQLEEAAIEGKDLEYKVKGKDIKLSKKKRIGTDNASYEIKFEIGSYELTFERLDEELVGA